MRHTGELFLQTPEAEHPLSKKLVLNTIREENNHHTMIALEQELIHTVLEFFDLRFSELVDFEYAPQHSKFALNLVRKLVLNNIEQIAIDGVTSHLHGRGIQSFAIVDCT
jgi:hypothetical protein